jgi:hypothetical protein
MGHGRWHECGIILVGMAPMSRNDEDADEGTASWLEFRGDTVTRIKDSLVAKVIITTALWTGGLVSANLLCPSPAAYYVVCVAIGLIPGTAFMYWALDESVPRFLFFVGFILTLAGLDFALDYIGWGPSSELRLLLFCVTALIAGRVVRHYVK